MPRSVLILELDVHDEPFERSRTWYDPIALPPAGVYWVAPVAAFTVAGAPLTIPVVFTHEFAVTVREKGLPAGTTWLVNVTGGAPHQSVRPSLSFTAANGSFTYTVSSILGPAYVAKGGSFVVAGAPVTMKSKFTHVTYVAEFTESGLPEHSKWRVTLGNGITGGSSRTTLKLRLSNGTYYYCAAAVSPGYYRTCGYVTVDGAATSVTVLFETVGDAPGMVPTLLGGSAGPAASWVSTVCSVRGDQAAAAPRTGG